MIAQFFGVLGRRGIRVLLDQQAKAVVGLQRSQEDAIALRGQVTRVLGDRRVAVEHDAVEMFDGVVVPAAVEVYLAKRKARVSCC